MSDEAGMIAGAINNEVIPLKKTRRLVAGMSDDDRTIAGASGINNLANLVTSFIGLVQSLVVNSDIVQHGCYNIGSPGAGLTLKPCQP